MTMHLARGLSMLNTKKPKRSKMTLGKITKYQEQMRKHNKHMRSIGCHDLQMNLQEYIDYCHGHYKRKTQKNASNDEFKPLTSVESYTRKTEDIPSLVTSNSFGPATKKEPMQYTGERRLVGIATMHKSNLVPVFSDEEAKELAKMRR